VFLNHYLDNQGLHKGLSNDSRRHSERSKKENKIHNPECDDALPKIQVTSNPSTMSYQHLIVTGAPSLTQYPSIAKAIKGVGAQSLLTMMLENQDGGMVGADSKTGTHLMPPSHNDHIYDLSGNNFKKGKESKIGEEMIAQSYQHQVKEDTNFLKDH
jgi:hypothetical protein